jgi:hypothetical protein
MGKERFRPAVCASATRSSPCQTTRDVGKALHPRRAGRGTHKRVGLCVNVAAIGMILLVAANGYATSARGNDAVRFPDLRSLTISHPPGAHRSRRSSMETSTAWSAAALHMISSPWP